MNAIAATTIVTFFGATIFWISGDKSAFWDIITITNIYLAAGLVLLELRK